MRAGPTATTRYRASSLPSTGASTSPSCSTSSVGSTGIWCGGPAGNISGSNAGNGVRWHGWPISPDDLPACSRTGGSVHVLMAGQWEPDEPRGSSPVLRAAGGAIPPADSPPARVTEGDWPGPRQSAGLAGSRACDAEEWQDSGGVAGVAAQRGGDVAVAVGVEDADGEVAQAGHGVWGVAGADLGGVLGEGGVADVVQRLDAPVASDPVGQAGGVGLGGGEVGDRVDRHGSPAAAAQGADPAGDADGLGGVGEVQAGDGGGLEAADLGAAVAAVAGVVGDGDVWPGQELELVLERGLVAFDGQQVGGVLVGDQPVGVRTLGVHGVGGQDPPGQVQASSSGWNPVISLLLVSTWVWARTPRLVWSIAASRWTWGLGWWPLPRRVLPSTATARLGGWDVGGGGCWLASQAPIARSSASASTRASTRRTVASSGGLKAPVRSRRTPSAARHLAGRVAGPLTDRGKRSGAGQHRGHRHGQHGGKRVPPAAPVAGIGDLGEVVEQVTIVLGCQRSGGVQPLGNRGNGG